MSSNQSPDMGKKRIHPGSKFGLLTALQEGPRRNGRECWECMCQCGTPRVVSRRSLLQGTQSCGCLKSSRSKEAHTIHGMKDTPEWRAWQGAKARITNSGGRDYARYGGRGLTMSFEWEADFMNFYRDVGPRPSNKHSLDRIDNSLGYIPGNVRWATAKEQATNRRSTRLLTHKGLTKSITEWAAHLGINRGTLQRRVNKGWGIERALTAPVRGAL